MKTRSDFKKAIDTGLIDGRSPVHVYPLPKGVVYEVQKLEGTDISIMTSGPREAVGTELGDILLTLGIKGKIVIGHATKDVALAKWLGYQENLVASEFGDFKIYVFGAYDPKAPIKEHPFHSLEFIKPLWISAEEVLPMVDDMSKDLLFDGFLIETGAAQYRILPQRYADGIVLGVYCQENKPAVGVVKIGHRIVRIGRLPYWIQRLPCNELASLRGKNCKIQYTTQLSGDHLKHYASAIIKWVNR